MGFGVTGTTLTRTLLSQTTDIPCIPYWFKTADCTAAVSGTREDDGTATVVPPGGMNPSCFNYTEKRNLINRVLCYKILLLCSVVIVSQCDYTDMGHALL